MVTNYDELECRQFYCGIRTKKGDKYGVWDNQNKICISSDGKYDGKKGIMDIYSNNLSEAEFKDIMYRLEKQYQKPKAKNPDIKRNNPLDIKARKDIMGSETAYSAALLPVDDRIEEYKDYSNNAMKGLAFIMDVNGSKGPKKEKLQKLTITDEKTGIKTETYKDALDIRSFNGAHFIAEEDPPAAPCSKFETYNGVNVNGTCYFKAPYNMGLDSAMN